jgi:hypothetical protein
MTRIIKLYAIGFVSSIILAAILNRFIHFFFTTLLISTMITFLVCSLYFWSDWRKLEVRSEENKHIRVMITALITISTFSFLSFIPINIDRSFSVLTLSTIYNQSGRNINLNTIQIKVSTFFKPQSKEILRRIEEQVSIGNLKHQGSKVVLTKKGHLQVILNKIVAYFFDLNFKYVDGLK